MNRLLCLAALLAATGCAMSRQSPSDRDRSQITTNLTNLRVGEKVRLTAERIGKDSAEHKGVWHPTRVDYLWESTDYNVLHVSHTGTLIVVGPGTAKVCAKPFKIYLPMIVDGWKMTYSDTAQTKLDVRVGSLAPYCKSGSSVP